MLGVGIARGMMTTLWHFFFAKPVTVQYPEERVDLPPWTRGRPRLIYDVDSGDLRCTACGACALACPVDVIKIEQHPAQGKGKILDRFDLDMGGCIECALCVEACPFRAIVMAPDFEFGTYDRERSLVFNMHELRIAGTSEVDSAMEFIQGVKRGLAGQQATAGPAGGGRAAARARRSERAWHRARPWHPLKEWSGVSSTDVFVAIVFYATAIVMVVGAIGMVLNRDMIRSAMLLVLTLGGVAVMYVLLSADFLAIAQLLVYVGAIMILMLFAVMLTPGQVDLPAGSPQDQRISAALTALAVGALAVGVVVTTPWNLRSAPLNTQTAEQIGSLLLTTYVLPFWIASVLLTVGLIGAI